MWLSLILLVLLLAIALMQGSQGLFSALIMTVLTICCAAAALGTYDWVAIHWLAPAWKPDYAHAIALAAIFGIPLVILRVLADKLVRRACLLPAWVDRVGGGFCGLITALLMVGIIAHTLQMIPFNGVILGYSRVARAVRQETEGAAAQEPPAPDAPERDYWLKPDRFALGFASVLSAGVFNSEKILGYDTPDLVQAVGWIAAVPSEVSRYAPPRSIDFINAERVAFVYKLIPEVPRAGTPASYEPQPPKSGHEFLVVRIRLKMEARDERKSYAFTLRQVRLVGRKRSDGPLVQYHAIATQQEDATQTTNRHVRYELIRNRDWPIVDKPIEPRDQNKEIEVVFEVPTGFMPTYVEYKRGAGALVQVKSASRNGDSSRPIRAAEPTRERRTEATPQPKPTDDDSASSPRSSRRERRERRSQPTSPEETVADSGRGGNVRGLTTRQAQSRFSDEMPMKLTAYLGLKNLRLDGEKIVEGHLVGEVQKQDGGTDLPVTKFAVPTDKRLLQLSTTRLHTRSGLGGALDFASRTVQNYFVQDASGKRFSIAGKYAIADVNDTPIIEVQYFSEPTGSMGGLGQFERIKDDDLKNDYELVLLFLVDPGAEIVSFSTGGSATRADDLRGEGLTAPN